NRERFFVIIFPAKENSRSTPALLAGTEKTRLAIFYKRGYNA
ncbi:unnamed protein product, partial [Rotaria socialis]